MPICNQSLYGVKLQKTEIWNAIQDILEGSKGFTFHPHEFPDLGMSQFELGILEDQ